MVVTCWKIDVLVKKLEMSVKNYLGDYLMSDNIRKMWVVLIHNGVGNNFKYFDYIILSVLGWESDISELQGLSK